VQPNELIPGRRDRPGVRHQSLGLLLLPIMALVILLRWLREEDR
jgi:hypothetical protein